MVVSAKVGLVLGHVLAAIIPFEGDFVEALHLYHLILGAFKGLRVELVIILLMFREFLFVLRIASMGVLFLLSPYRIVNLLILAIQVRHFYHHVVGDPFFGVETESVVSGYAQHSVEPGGSLLLSAFELRMNNVFLGDGDVDVGGQKFVNFVKYFFKIRVPAFFLYAFEHV